VRDSDTRVILVWLDGTEDVTLPELPGSVITVPWNPDAEDGGRTDLLTSLRDARDAVTSRGGNADELTLVGIGRGAVAAAGLTRYARRLGIGLGQILCVAGTWDEPDPFSGAPLKGIPEQVELVESADQLKDAISRWRPR